MPDIMTETSPADPSAVPPLRTFHQLTPEERVWALGRSAADLLRFIVEGGLRFEDQELQGKIDRALGDASRMRTPWFAHEYVMDYAGDDIVAMAHADAEDRLYAPQGVHVVNVPSRIEQRGAPEKPAALVAA